MNTEQQLADDIGRFYADPLGFVMYAYPWHKPELQMVELQEPWRSRFGSQYGPDVWACELLDEIGNQVLERNFDGVHAVDAIRMAVASGHGIGKSAITAWIVDWIASTRPFSKGTVTATTAPQLASKTWAEIAKWTKLCITSHWFEVSTGRGSMRLYHKQYPESWFCTAQTCDETNSESFAGQHAANSSSYYIFDEASGVPDTIQEVAEGGLTDGQPFMLAFGNPTRNTGWFRECFSRQRHRWHTRQIDSRSVAITNKKVIAEWVADYGENSDFVKVRVRGTFPSMSAKQFIGIEDVDAAFGRHLRIDQYGWAPKILTCDPAWEGDDMLEIGLRQGLHFRILRTIPKNDNDLEIANILARIEDEEQADAVFIDAGYGTGIYSAGQSMKRDWQLVWFGGKSADPGCLNKRSEIWQAMKNWLKSGGAIPPNQDLYQDLIGPETIARADGLIQLESKKDMKARGLPSPGKADALAISFAYPVVAKGQYRKDSAPPPERDHNPYSTRAHENTRREHNPFAKR